MKATTERRVAGLEADVAALVRRLLPASAPDPSDPSVLVSYLTDEELARLESAAATLGGNQPIAAWDDMQRRAVARMLTGADVKALSAREFDGRVLVEISTGEPPISGRTRLVGYVPDQSHPDLWHVEACYRGVLPRTLTTAELAAHDPQPWPRGRCDEGQRDLLAEGGAGGALRAEAARSRGAQGWRRGSLPTTTTGVAVDDAPRGSDGRQSAIQARPPMTAHDRQRYEQALELVDDAEALVCQAEQDLDAAGSYLERDVAETELRACLAIQDQALAAAAPAIAAREAEIRAGVRAAIAALRRDPGSDWMQRHRRWHPIAVKARLVRLVGRKVYEGALPL